MNDTELDVLLAAARPEVPHDEDCVPCRGAVARRPVRRWRRRLAVAGAAGVAVVAVGAGAAATVGLPFVDRTAPREHTQTVSTGDRCYLTFRAQPDAPDSDPAAVEDARSFLAALDIGSLDIADELADLAAEYADVTWDGPGPRPDFVYAIDSQDSRESQALSAAVSQAVWDHLRANGFDVDAVMMQTEFICDDHDQVQRR